MKTCTSCGALKPIESFEKLYKNQKHKESRRNVCSTCRNRSIYLMRKARGDFKDLREQVISEYGGKCACCGESCHEFLSIDHIGNWGHTEKSHGRGGSYVYRKLRASGFPKDRYRLLCHNCNLSIGFYGYCPHHPLIVCTPAWEMRKTDPLHHPQALVRGHK